MTDQEQCRQLYAAAFSPDEVFDRELFDGFFDCCRYLKQDGRVTSMLFALPCRLLVDGKRYPARYLYAAATGPAFRRRGEMTRLLEQQAADADEVLFLKPADKALEAYYRRRGFEPVHARRAIGGDPAVLVEEAFRQLARDDRPDGTGYTLMVRSRIPLALDGLAFGYPME